MISTKAMVEYVLQKIFGAIVTAAKSTVQAAVPWFLGVRLANLSIDKCQKTEWFQFPTYQSSKEPKI